MSDISEMPPEISSIIKLGDGDYMKIEQMLQELESAAEAVVKCRAIAALLRQANHDDDYLICQEDNLTNIASIMYDLCDNTKTSVSTVHKNLKQFLTEKRLNQLK